MVTRLVSEYFQATTEDICSQAPGATGPDLRDFWTTYK